jgi:hypothetical protein
MTLRAWQYSVTEQTKESLNGLIDQLAANNSTQFPVAAADAVKAVIAQMPDDPDRDISVTTSGNYNPERGLANMTVQVKIVDVPGA